MTKYLVTVPVAGYYTAVVEADSQFEAEDKAIDADFFIDVKSDDGVELEELEPLRKIVEGNVCYAPQWYIESEEIEND